MVGREDGGAGGEEGYQGGGGRVVGGGTLRGNDSRFCSEFFTRVLTKVTVAGDIEASQSTLTLRLGRRTVLEQYRISR